MAQRTPILIAVIGVTGAGKSTFINKACGSNLPVGHSIVACTKTLACADLYYEGSLIRLIDTPGFDNTLHDDVSMLQEVSNCLSACDQEGLLLSGIVLLSPVSASRVIRTELSRLDLFQAICGNDAMKIVTIATTMWSELSNQEQGRKRVEERIGSKSLWENMVSNGAVVVRHDNTTASALKIISAAIRNKPQKLELQIELGRSHGKIHRTYAAHRLGVYLEEKKEQSKEELKRLESELKNVKLPSHEQDVKHELAHEGEKLVLLEDQLARLREIEVQVSENALAVVDALRLNTTIDRVPGIVQSDKISDFELHKAFQGHLFLSRGARLPVRQVTSIFSRLAASPGLEGQRLSHSNENVLSWFQGCVERFTQQRWHWWPLPPRTYPIQKGYSRIVWRDPEGRAYELDFPQDVRSYFNSLPIVGGGAKSDKTPSSTSTSSAQPIPRPVPAHLQPVSSSSTTTFAYQGSLPDARPLVSQGSTSQVTQHSLNANNLHVYLGVRAGKGCKFGHILLTKQTDDLMFFITLKKQYRKLRGWRQLCFSLWQYEYCDFFEYRKSAAKNQSGSAVRHGYPLPNHDYDMNPCPVIDDPPIWEQDFSDYYYNLQDSEPRSAGATCKDLQRQLEQILSSSTIALSLLPKKKEALIWKDGRYDTFWGLYAVEVPSFVHIFLGFILCIAPCIAFFFLWLFQWQHASDLQNASVPMTISLALITLFIAYFMHEHRERLAVLEKK